MPTTAHQTSDTLRSLTREQIVGLPTQQLRAIVRSTSPQTVRFAAELSWAKEELRRRRTIAARGFLRLALSTSVATGV